MLHAAKQCIPISDFLVPVFEQLALLIILLPPIIEQLGLLFWLSLLELNAIVNPHLAFSNAEGKASGKKTGKTKRKTRKPNVYTEEEKAKFPSLEIHLPRYRFLRFGTMELQFKPTAWLLLGYLLASPSWRINTEEARKAVGNLMPVWPPGEKRAERTMRNLASTINGIFATARIPYMVHYRHAGGWFWLESAFKNPPVPLTPDSPANKTQAAAVSQVSHENHLSDKCYNAFPVPSHAIDGLMTALRPALGGVPGQKYYQDGTKVVQFGPNALPIPFVILGVVETSHHHGDSMT
jgi:hypothetical protein